MRTMHTVRAALALFLAALLTGCGDDGDDTMGPGDDGGDTPQPVATAVGAAYPAATAGTYILIDKTGTRFVEYDRAAGTFTAPQGVSALEGGCPVAAIGAVTHDVRSTPEETYFVDVDTRTLTAYDRTAGSFAPAEDVMTRFSTSPFPAVGAAFTLGAQAFWFNAGGVSYSARYAQTGTWSPVYSFAGDFGGGGAPLASVGAAVVLEDGGDILLFDLSGTKFAIYTGNGVFTAAFTLDDLGDGSLAF